MTTLRSTDVEVRQSPDAAGQRSPDRLVDWDDPVVEKVKRRRRPLGRSDDVCEVCGNEGLEVVESARVLQPGDRLRLRRRKVRRYQRCPDCGARSPVSRSAVRAAASSGGVTSTADPYPSRRGNATLRGMGKGLLGLMLLVVAIEMIAVVVVGIVLVLLGNTQTTLIGIGMMFAAVIAAILTWRFARRPV